MSEEEFGTLHIEFYKGREIKTHGSDTMFQEGKPIKSPDGVVWKAYVGHFPEYASAYSNTKEKAIMFMKELIDNDNDKIRALTGSLLFKVDPQLTYIWGNGNCFVQFCNHTFHYGKHYEHCSCGSEDLK